MSWRTTPDRTTPPPRPSPTAWRHQHGHLAQRHSSPHRHHSQPGADTETAGAGRRVVADILLFRGSEGPQVTQLQRQLMYGYTAYAGHLVIDGVYGPQTEAAVREFQRRTQGLKIDGIVGPATAAALNLRVVAPAEPVLVADNETD